MKIVVPMAGRGSRLEKHFPDKPKPLIELKGRPMVEWSIRPFQSSSSDWVFILQRSAEEHFSACKTLDSFRPGCDTVLLDGVTEGQLCTVLAAIEDFDEDDSVLIVPSDTIVLSNILREIEKSPHCAGMLSLAEKPGDNWSFAKIGDNNEIIETAEKTRISPWASTGIYYFSKAKYIRDYGNEAIENNMRVNNEFYIAPIYNLMIRDGLQILPSYAQNMYDMGSMDNLLETLDKIESIAF